MGVDNPLSDWVPEGVWGAVQALREVDDYATLPDDLVGSSKRWREWMELERPGERARWVAQRPGEVLPGAVGWGIACRAVALGTPATASSADSTPFPHRLPHGPPPCRGRAAARRLEAHAGV